MGIDVHHTTTDFILPIVLTQASIALVGPVSLYFRDFCLHNIFIVVVVVVDFPFHAAADKWTAPS